MPLIKIFNKKKINLSVLKKILLEKGFTIKKKKEFFHFDNFKSFYYTFIFSIVLILFSFFLPFSLNLKKDLIVAKTTVENNSKKNFQKVLEGKPIKKNKNEKIDDGLDIKNLFEDIFSFEQVPTDTVRLSASTIKQLFKETNYNLDEVRKKGIVKPIKLSLLPGEMKKIESTKKKKNLFIQIVLPLIIEENNRIKLDRKKLFAILNRSNNTNAEKKWLNLKFKQYGVLKKDLSTLKVRMDEVPISLAIAQAAKETGWGTSRFAIEGNALFGQWTWSGDGIKPAGIDTDNVTHKVMKFKVLKASVRAYQRNLNTHPSYREFRRIRAEQRDREEKLNSLELVKFLDKYAATGKEYTEVIKKIIEQNSLTDFDDAYLLPKSKKIKNLI